MSEETGHCFSLSRWTKKNHRKAFSLQKQSLVRSVFLRSRHPIVTCRGKLGLPGSGEAFAELSLSRARPALRLVDDNLGQIPPVMNYVIPAEGQVIPLLKKMPDACNINLQSTLLGLILVRNEVNALFHIGSTFWLRLEPILFVFAPLLGPAVSGLINLLDSRTSTTCYTRLEIFYTAHLKVQCSFPTAANQLRKNLQLALGFKPSTLRLESLSWGLFHS